MIWFFPSSSYFFFPLICLTLILKPRVESQTSKIKWRANQLINHSNTVIQASSEGLNVDLNITEKLHWFSETFWEALRSHGSHYVNLKHNISQFHCCFILLVFFKCKYLSQDVLAVLAAQHMKNGVFGCLNCLFLFPPDWNWPTYWLLFFLVGFFFFF